MNRLAMRGTLVVIGLQILGCGSTDSIPTGPATSGGKADSPTETQIGVVQMITSGCATETCKLPPPVKEGDGWKLPFGFDAAPSGVATEGRWVRGAFITPPALIDYYTHYSTIEEILEEYEVPDFNGLCEAFQDKWSVSVAELPADQGLATFLKHLKDDVYATSDEFLNDWLGEEEDGQELITGIKKLMDGLEQGKVNPTSISRDLDGDFEFSFQAGVAVAGEPQGEAAAASAKIASAIRERLGSLLNPELRDRILAALKEGTFLHYRDFDTTSEMLAQEYFVILPKNCDRASCPGALVIDIYYSEVD